MTLVCKRNPGLCRLAYEAGRKDGCTGKQLMKALPELGWRGIDSNYIYASEIKKGNVLNSEEGPKGPGLNFRSLGSPLCL